MKTMMAALLSMALSMTGLPAAAAGHAGMYCEKHCNITALKKEVKALEKAVEKDKEALKKGRNPDKGSYTEQRNRVKAHLKQHMMELEDLQNSVESMEKELTDMENK